MLWLLACHAGEILTRDQLLRATCNIDYPYPYVFLNLILSILAALQAPIIMMSQNRQGARDRLDAEIDHEVNVRAELTVRDLDARMMDIESKLELIHESLKQHKYRNESAE